MYFKYMNLWYVTYVKLLKKKKKPNRMNTDQKIIWREMETKFHPPPKFLSFKFCQNLVLQWEIFMWELVSWEIEDVYL